MTDKLLTHLFSDLSPFNLLSFIGPIKVGIKDDKLVAGLELGFPPSVPPDYA